MEIKYQVVLVDKQSGKEYILSTRLTWEAADKLEQALRSAQDYNNLQIYEKRPYIQ